MAPPAPRILVEAPPFTPARFGLLSAVALVDEADEHWQNGVKHQPIKCDPALVYIDECPPEERPAKQIDRGRTTVGSDPFTVYAVDACSTGGVNYTEARERAGAALANGEARTIEALLWGGGDYAGLVNPQLARDTQVLTNGLLLQRAAAVVGGDPTDIVSSIGRLEKGLGACYGGVGVIHLDRAQAIAGLGAGVLTIDGERLTTKLGTRVAAYSMGAGVGPDGEGAGWMYATGAVKVVRGGIDIDGMSDDEVIDRTVNNRTVIAERTYTITWDCCLLATQGPNVEHIEEA